MKIYKYRFLPVKTEKPYIIIIKYKIIKEQYVEDVNLYLFHKVELIKGEAI